MGLRHMLVLMLLAGLATANPFNLDENTIYDADANTCHTTRGDFEILTENCHAVDGDGKDITHTAHFTWKGDSPLTTKWVFVYTGELAKARAYYMKNESVSVWKWRRVVKWGETTIHNVVGFDSFPKPTDLLCQVGNANNTLIYNVTFAGGNSTMYCFSEYENLGGGSWRMGGNYTTEERYQGTEHRIRYSRLSDKVSFLGSNLLGRGFGAYYLVGNATFDAGETKSLIWQFTPTTGGRGEWHIFGYPAGKLIGEALNEGQYIYQDPEWQNASYPYKIEFNVTNQTSHPIFNWAVHHEFYNMTNLNNSADRGMLYCNGTEAAFNATSQGSTTANISFIVDLDGVVECAFYYGNASARTAIYDTGFRVGQSDKTVNVSDSYAFDYGDGTISKFYSFDETFYNELYSERTMAVLDNGANVLFDDLGTCYLQWTGSMGAEFRCNSSTTAIMDYWFSQPYYKLAQQSFSGSKLVDGDDEIYIHLFGDGGGTRTYWYRNNAGGYSTVSNAGYTQTTSYGVGCVGNDAYEECVGWIWDENVADTNSVQSRTDDGAVQPRIYWYHNSGSYGDLSASSGTSWIGIFNQTTTELDRLYYNLNNPPTITQTHEIQGKLPLYSNCSTDDECLSDNCAVDWNSTAGLCCNADDCNNQGACVNATYTACNLSGTYTQYVCTSEAWANTSCGDDTECHTCASGEGQGCSSETDTTQCNSYYTCDGSGNCLNSCTTQDNDECHTNAYCNVSGQCTANQSDGESCDSVCYGSVSCDQACEHDCDNDGAGLPDDLHCYSPHNTYYDNQETDKCEYDTGTGTSYADERAAGDNTGQCIGLDYYIDYVNTTCGITDNTTHFNCTGTGCGCDETCDGQTSGTDFNNCAAGNTYFQDACSTTGRLTDADNICRSANTLTTGDGCTADADCDGIEAGTGDCSTTCTVAQTKTNSLLSQILQVLEDTFLQTQTNKKFNYHLLCDDEITFTKPDLNKRLIQRNITIDAETYFINDTWYYCKHRRINQNGYGPWSELRKIKIIIP